MWISLLKHLALLTIVFVVGFSIGLLWPESPMAQSPIFREVRLNEGFKFINPLLECGDNLGSYKIPNEIRDQIENYISTKKLSGDLYAAAVYYRNLNNGPWFGIDEDTMFAPASLTKVPMMLLYFKMAERDPQVLEKTLSVDIPMVSTPENTFVDPKIVLDRTKEYTVLELIEHMIVYSDNHAYAVLKSNINEKEFNQMFEDFGIDINSRISSGSDNVLTIREYSSFFRILYNSSYLNREYSEKALFLLSRSAYSDGLVSGVPENVPVAHKFGERFYDNSNEKQFHDCGIVYAPESPYLLCIMTKGNDLGTLSGIIAEISGMVYEMVKLDSQI